MALAEGEQEHVPAAAGCPTAESRGWRAGGRAGGWTRSARNLRLFDLAVDSYRRNEEQEGAPIDGAEEIEEQYEYGVFLRVEQMRVVFSARSGCR
jgi:hypothetical protein